MPRQAKPLFRPDVLAPIVRRTVIARDFKAVRAALMNWVRKLKSDRVQAMKETELLPDYFRDVFIDCLGYVGPVSEAATYTFKREALVKVDGKFADAVIGQFTTDGSEARIVAAVEGKGPRDPLDRPHGSRARSAVEQALQYAVQLEIDWYIVTNLNEIRLYHKGHDTLTFERFVISDMVADSTDLELRRFLFLLEAGRIVPKTGVNHLDGLLAESRKFGRELTDEFYKDYKQLRLRTYEHLRTANPAVPPLQLVAAAQKMLDRVLFIAFGQSRTLLPAGIIDAAFRQSDPFNPRPVWDNFKGLFRSVDVGNELLGIDRYNGGLFAEDTFLDSLAVPNAVCEGFKKIGGYEFGVRTDNPDAKIIDVEILGHIFEQSISDLEEMARAVAGPVVETAAKKAPSKRKKEGAFYTPAFVTRYIVAETLNPVLAEAYNGVLREQQDKAAKAVRKALDDPKAYEADALNKPQKEALARFWDAWQDRLQTIRIIDPSCGSGAFLIEAFEQLYEYYRECRERLIELRGPSMFEIDRQILTCNLFGMDLNSEAVEIARLSLWIKTAEQGKVLTSLDANVVEGNSVATPPDPLTAWTKRFPEVFAAGGFDVVIGNPPYVRQEWIKADKPFLEQHYAAYDGVADLYVYFYELGLKVLKPGGRLGFIVTNKWLKAGYGEALRKHYGEAAWVESVVDFGHAKQIFPDADVFPCILIARKPAEEPPPETARVCIIPREQLRIDDLSRQIQREGDIVPRARFAHGPWNLEPPGAAKLMEKLSLKGVPLKDFAGTPPISGIKTGFNEAYLIDEATKERLVKSDPNSSSLFRPFMRGLNVDRWWADSDRSWMLAIKSSANQTWPWTGRNEADGEKVFRSTYPTLFEHFDRFRTQLIERKNPVRYWWELSAGNYWESFDKPKIMYQEIHFTLAISTT